MPDGSQGRSGPAAKRSVRQILMPHILDVGIYPGGLRGKSALSGDSPVSPADPEIVV